MLSEYNTASSAEVWARKDTILGFRRPFCCCVLPTGLGVQVQMDAPPPSYRWCYGSPRPRIPCPNELEPT